MQWTGALCPQCTQFVQHNSPPKLNLLSAKIFWRIFLKIQRKNSRDATRDQTPQGCVVKLHGVAVHGIAAQARFSCYSASFINWIKKTKWVFSYLFYYHLQRRLSFLVPYKLCSTAPSSFFFDALLGFQFCCQAIFFELRFFLHFLIYSIFFNKKKLWFNFLKNPPNWSILQNVELEHSFFL